VRKAIDIVLYVKTSRYRLKICDQLSFNDILCLILNIFIFSYSPYLTL